MGRRSWGTAKNDAIKIKGKHWGQKSDFSKKGSKSLRKRKKKRAKGKQGSVTENGKKTLFTKEEGKAGKGRER